MDDDFFAGGDLFDDDVAFSSIADAAASQPDLSILSLSAQFGDDKKLIKRSHTVSHTSDSWKSLTSTLPIYDQSLSPADLLASSQLLFAVTNLSVARAFAGEIFDNGALPHITSYIPTTLPPSPIPAPHLACIINAIAAVRNLACAHRHVRDAVRETGTCDRILVLLRESTDDQPNDDIACAALGALRNVTHSCKETTNRLTSLGVIPLLQSLLSSESKLARRESLFRACGTLVNICECEPDAANEFVNCDRPKLVAFRAVSDLNVGKIEVSMHRVAGASLVESVFRASGSRALYVSGSAARE